MNEFNTEYLKNGIKKIWNDPEIQALARRCFFKKFKCTPVIMEKVCASGSKCFHDIHYLFLSEGGAPIPADACPINCVVSNFIIYGVNGGVNEAGLEHHKPKPDPEPVAPHRIGDCVYFTVGYRVRVWYEYFDTTTSNLEVGLTSEFFQRELAVPIEEIDGGCVLCQPEALDLCIRRLNLDCIRAVVVPRPSGFPTTFPPFAIETTVEKEFFALESGRSIICLPTCVQDCIDLPFPVSPGECVPFERPAQCTEFCEESDLNPGECAECPPLTTL